MLVSVCVPAYERPRTTELLVRSFLEQDYPNKELCISDDSLGAEVGGVVERLRAPLVRYSRNPQNLGFARNLRQALAMARGEVAIVLGDDDFLASRDALSAYARAFRSHPEAQFAMPNILQVDAQGRVNLAYAHFSETRAFRGGSEAVEALWLRTVLISGMAIRGVKDVLAFYPDGDLLFPQIPLVGELLATHAGVGIGEYLVAARAHAGQLGFHAIRGQLIKGDEQHGVIEVMRSISALTDHHADVALVRSRLERQLVFSFLTNMPNERLLTGRRALMRNVWALLKSSPRARRSLSLLVTAGAVLAAPTGLLLRAKERARSVLARTRFRQTPLDSNGLVSALEGQLDVATRQREA